MRNTIQRSIVLSAVRALKTHPTAEEIYREINTAHPNISRGTVYRNLNVLAEQGTILRVLIPDAADRFDFNTVGHYHFRCRECDRVTDVDYPYQADINSEIARKYGCEVTEHTIVFSGRCAECIAKDRIVMIE